jgi:hypothetical protein
MGTPLGTMFPMQSVSIAMPCINMRTARKCIFCRVRPGAISWEPAGAFIATEKHDPPWSLQTATRPHYSEVVVWAVIHKVRWKENSGDLKRTYIWTSPVFKSGCLGTNIKLTLYKVLIRSVMSYDLCLSHLLSTQRTLLSWIYSACKTEYSALLETLTGAHKSETCTCLPNSLRLRLRN